ncbi:MAG: PEGA domain-containing protein [Caldithrix sp.]|nr:MAG: PEGA domain-containing protein [Caldithrix sp.]
MQKDPLIGKTVSHYKIVDYLGGGGMGMVYKAEDIKLKRTVALKFLPLEFTRNPEAKTRFMKEAHAAASLDHPRIGTIYEVDETDDGHMYIAMAFYEGETLKDVHARGPIPLKRVIELVLQIANGLASAHEKEITHRDIKPANIMITEDGFVKIVDFGLAKLGDSTKITKSGLAMGTPAYMSPEQVKGTQVDHRSDIWSLGIILYELLTRRLPFRGDNEMAMLYNIVNEEPAPASRFNPEIPSRIEKIIHHSIVKNTSERYASINEFIEDLKQAQAGESVLTNADKSPKIPLDSDQMRTIVKPAAGSKKAARKPKAGKGGRVVVVVALFFLALVVLGIMNFSKIEALLFEDKIGYLEIISEPAGATILVNAEKQRKSTPTLLGPLEAGTYEVSLTAAGFESWSKIVAISENDTVLKTVRLVPLTPSQPKVGKVEISSIPPGASIFVDSRDTGKKTPAVLRNLTVEEHEILLTKNGFEPFEGFVSVSSEQTGAFAATLKKTPALASDKVKREKAIRKSVGSLFVESNPSGAAIYLDGKPTGNKTPHKFAELKTGTYKIRLALDGYEDKIQNETIRANVPIKTKIQLTEAAPGFLFVQVFILGNGSKRRDASTIDVYIDGNNVGTGWTKYEIKSGVHSVKAVKTGFNLQRGEQKVSIASGQTVNIELIFVKR